MRKFDLQRALVSTDLERALFRETGVFFRRRSEASLSLLTDIGIPSLGTLFLLQPVPVLAMLQKLR
jgi:hypothetical protein